MTTFARITVNENALRALVTSSSGPVVEKVGQVTRQTANAARVFCPVDTGLLRASIDETVSVEGWKVVGRVSAETKYAVFVHQGTRYMRARPFLVDALVQVSPWPVSRKD